MQHDITLPPSSSLCPPFYLQMTQFLVKFLCTCDAEEQYNPAEYPLQYTMQKCRDNGSINA